MTNAIATLPVFSREDVRKARAWALSYGEPIGERGRMPRWLLLDWDKNLRPVPSTYVARPEIDSKQVSGKRGAPTVVLTKDGGWKPISRDNARNARRWALREGMEVPAHGRLSVDVLQAWANAGEPEIAPDRVEVATVYYVKKNAVTGNLYSKIHAITVYADMLAGGRGRPAMSAYVEAVQDDMPKHAVPVRITTANTIVDVGREDDGTYTYAWVSKADSKTVVDMIKAHIAL